MNVEGVWQIELMGPHEWERFGTAFLRQGRYLGGNANHYATGSYAVDEVALTADLEVTPEERASASRN